MNSGLFSASLVFKKWALSITGLQNSRFCSLLREWDYLFCSVLFSQKGWRMMFSVQISFLFVCCSIERDLYKLTFRFLRCRCWCCVSWTPLPAAAAWPSPVTTSILESQASVLTRFILWENVCDPGWNF